MGADNSGVTESRHQQKRWWWEAELSHFPIVPGSVLAVLLRPVCLQPHHCCVTRCPWHCSFPASCEHHYHRELFFPCLHIGLGLEGQVLISESSVSLEWSSLWSQHCFLYICVCATEIQTGTRWQELFLPFFVFCGCYLEKMLGFTHA